MGILDLSKNASQVERQQQSNGGKRPSKVLIPRNNQTYKFIIPNEEFVVNVSAHYLRNRHGGTYVPCFGAECPVCKRNSEIMESHPDSFRDNPEYRSTSTRVGILIFDLTPYRYCKSCGSENNIDEGTCFRCKKPELGEPEPANAYKTLALSLNQAIQLSTSLHDFIGETGLDFGKFYTKLVVVPSEGNRRTLTFSNYPLAEDISIPEIEFDPEILAKYTVPQFTVDEVVLIMSGTSVREIYQMRRVQGNVEDKPSEAPEEVKEAISKLFSE